MAEHEHNPFQSYDGDDDDDDIFGDDGAEDMLHGPMEDLSLSVPGAAAANDGKPDVNGGVGVGDPLLFGGGAGGTTTTNENNNPPPTAAATATATAGVQGQGQGQQSIGGGGGSLMEQLTGAPSVMSHRTTASGNHSHVTPPTPPPSRNTSNASAAPATGGAGGGGGGGVNKSSLLASLTGGGGGGDEAANDNGDSHLFGIGGDTDEEEEEEGEEDLFGAVTPVVKSPPPPEAPKAPQPQPQPHEQQPAAANAVAAAAAHVQPPPPSFYRSHDPGLLQQRGRQQVQQGQEGQWGGGGGGAAAAADGQRDDPLRNMNVRGDGGGTGGADRGVNHYEYRPAMNLPDPVPGYGQQQQRPPTHQQRPPPTRHQQPMSPNPRAGLHVPAPAGGGGQRQSAPPPPSPKPYVYVTSFEPLYDEVAVTDPSLVREGGGVFGVGAASHWSYAVRSRDLGPDGRGAKVVQRRFRHFVALEGRLRSCCPGAVLPPRPEKHATRAIEEGQAQQSLGFARARARELDRYLHALVRHPIAGSAEPLRFFLSFFDDLGTAWPEVSPNALTRLTQNLPWGGGGGAAAGGVGGFGGGGGLGGMASSGILGNSYDGSESMWAGTGAGGGSVFGGGPPVGGGAAMASATSTYSPTEENAELLALHHTENIRLTQVSQCVPKLEGAITLQKQHNLAMGTAGMEFSKLSRDIAPTDQLLSKSVDVLAVGMLRSARRMKRLSAELGGAIAPFVHEYKLVPMERAAFQDRRNALQRRHTMRQKADAKAQKLMLYQNATAFEAQGALAGEVEKLQLEASESDDLAVETMRQAEEIGNVLQGEVARLKQIRTKEWLSAMKIVAESMKVASEEQRIIWEGAREQYNAAFPNMATRDQQPE